MKKITIMVGVAILAIMSQISTVVAIENQSCQAILDNEQIIEKLVDKYSVKYNVSKVDLLRTLKNENRTFDFDLQSGLKYKKGNRWGFPAGTLEKSYGVAQIHLPDHPEITYEQAIDPEFSVAYMASEFSKGRAKQWMGYRG
jgi:hypothetical protein